MRPPLRPKAMTRTVELRDEDRVFRVLLTLLILAYSSIVPVAYVVAPDVQRIEVRGYARGPGTSHLPAAPPAEPQQPVDWGHEAWLADAVRLRSMTELPAESAARLGGLYGDASALFPDWVGRVPRAPEPLDLRLVEPRVLNDPTFIDAGESRTILGLYFSRENIAYASPATGDEDVILHEVTHHLYDAYEIELDTGVEEDQVHRFVHWVRGVERHLDRPHLDQPVADPELMREHEGVAGVRLWSAAPPSPMRVIWLGRVIDAAVERFPVRAGVRPRAIAPFELVLHRGATTCRAAASPRMRRIDAWVDGCRKRRGAEQLGHALGHLLVVDYGLVRERRAVERLSYGTGGAVVRELLIRGYPVALEDT
jgi:hypothetical protein